MIAQEPATHSPHHRAVPLHKGFKDGLVPMFNETAQKFPITRGRLIPWRCCPTKLLDDLVELAVHHSILDTWHCPSTVYFRGQGALIHYFLKVLGFCSRWTRARE